MIHSTAALIEELDDIWIMKAPVISTCHVTREEMEQICEGELDDLFGYVLQYPEGVIFFLGDEIDLDRNLLSPGFIAAIEFAHGLGFRWLRFDRDGDAIDGIPSYDW